MGSDLNELMPEDVDTGNIGPLSMASPLLREVADKPVGQYTPVLLCPGCRKQHISPFLARR